MDDIIPPAMMVLRNNTTAIGVVVLFLTDLTTVEQI